MDLKIRGLVLVNLAEGTVKRLIPADCSFAILM